MRRALATLLTLLLVGGCLPGQRDASSYTLTAVFDEAVGLYERSRVKVMGFDVGLVDRIEVVDDGVEVTISIDEDVPLPADVRAAIVPFTVIGERNILLHPAWQPGDERLTDGAVLDGDRTSVPVEVDDALETFVELSEALDAEAIQRLLSTSAVALAGRGEELGATLDAVDELIAAADGLDGQVLALAEDVTTLSSTLNAREDDLIRLIDGVAQAGAIARDNRDDAQSMLRALIRLNDEGAATLEGYTEALPARLEELARLGLVLRANTGEVQALVRSLDRVGVALDEAFVERDDALSIRLNTSTVVTELLAALLAEVLGVVLP